MSASTTEGRPSEGTLQAGYELACQILEAEFLVDAAGERKLSRVVVKAFLEAGGIIDVITLADVSAHRWRVLCNAYVRAEDKATV